MANDPCNCKAKSKFDQTTIKGLGYWERISEEFNPPQPGPDWKLIEHRKKIPAKYITYSEELVVINNSTPTSTGDCINVCKDVKKIRTDPEQVERKNLDKKLPYCITLGDILWYKVNYAENAVIETSYKAEYKLMAKYTSKKSYYEKDHFCGGNDPDCQPCNNLQDKDEKKKFEEGLKKTSSIPGSDC